MAKMGTYRVTDAAGPFVAGRRVPTRFEGVGDERREVRDPDYRLKLSEEQARYELLNGTIELDVPASATKPDVPTASTGDSDAGTGTAGQ